MTYISDCAPVVQPYANISATYPQPVGMARRTGHQILREVAERHRIPIDRLIGPSKLQRIVHIRFEAMYLIRQETDLSFPNIGRIFGLHHTTIMNGCRRWAEMIGLGHE